VSLVPPGAPELPRQLVRFVLIGVASTLAYLLLYLVLRGVMAAQAANALSLLATALANTWLNRRFTFGIRGAPGAARHQALGLLAFAAGLLLTSGALAALHAVSPRPGRAAEVTVLLLASLVATAARFCLYRFWVFRHRPAAEPRRGPGETQAGSDQAGLAGAALTQTASPQSGPGQAALIHPEGTEQ
jgi:putative flippase GtrA